MTAKLKYIDVITSDDAMVPDFTAQDCGIRRFINRSFVEGEWRKDDSPSSVLETQEIRNAIRQGDLIVAKQKAPKKDK